MLLLKKEWVSAGCCVACTKFCTFQDISLGSKLCVFSLACLAVNCQHPQTCRHWHRGLSTTQCHGDRCCRGNGAAAAWIFQANKCALTNSSPLPNAPHYSLSQHPPAWYWWLECKLQSLSQTYNCIYTVILLLFVKGTRCSGWIN